MEGVVLKTSEGDIWLEVESSSDPLKSQNWSEDSKSPPPGLLSPKYIRSIFWYSYFVQNSPKVQ